MDVDEVSENPKDTEDQNLIFYDRQEKNDRQNSIDIFKDKHSYQNANSIADSKILSRIMQRYIPCMRTIFLENFLRIKENQDHHLKIKWKLYWLSLERTWIKFKFKENAMSYCL